MACCVEKPVSTERKPRHIQGDEGAELCDVRAFFGEPQEIFRSLTAWRNRR